MGFIGALIRWTFLIVVGAFALHSWEMHAGDHTPQVRPSTQPSESTAAQSGVEADLDHAFEEFKGAAERLGKSMAKAADIDTADARRKIKKTMSSAMLELSHSMDRATKKIESSSSDKK